MRAASVWGEAWRNLLTGTTRAALLATVFALSVGLLGFVDVRSVVAVQQGATSFQAAGGAVSVLKTGTAAIDGRRCDAVGGTGAIKTAGAIRSGPSTTFAVLPSAHIATIEATPGLVAMLPVVAKPLTFDPDAADGIWLSSDLATALGATPGAKFLTSAGPATVSGIYAWPDDGRAHDLAYTMIAPVPAAGRFTQCWAQIWPAGDWAKVLYTAIAPTETTPQTTLGQLNTAFGLNYDTNALLNKRLTSDAPWLSVLIGLALGFVAVRMRRLEIASGLHAGVARVDLTAQHVIEALAWTVTAALIAAVAVTWAARWGAADLPWVSTWRIGLLSIVAGLAGSILGTLAGVALTRERQLFRYMKDGGR